MNAFNELRLVANLTFSYPIPKIELAPLRSKRYMCKVVAFYTLRPLFGLAAVFLAISRNQVLTLCVRSCILHTSQKHMRNSRSIL